MRGMVKTSIDSAITRHVRESRVRPVDIGRALGLTRQSVGDRLAGRARWQAAELPAVAGLLGMSVDQLLDPAASVGIPQQADR